MRTIVISIMFLFVCQLFNSTMMAQERKIRAYLETSYLYGLSEVAKSQTINREHVNMSGMSLHLTGLYSISKQFAAGVGLGLDRYDNPGYNTFPVYVAAHYAPLSNNSNLYTFTNIGYGIGGEAFTKGLIWDIGVGYKLMLKQFGFVFKFGYNLKGLHSVSNGDWFDLTDTKENRTRHSLILGVGFIF